MKFLNSQMSQNKGIKTNNYFKCYTKPKKIKNRFIFDLNEIDKRFHISQSLKKEEKENQNDNENGNIITKNTDKKSNIVELEIIPLKKIYNSYKDWKNSNLIFEKFEKDILNKKNFEINYDTYEIRTKNEKACECLKNEKFWILYYEYLKRNSKINDGKDFLKIINLAFSYIEFEYKLLLVFYLDKIKKYNPIMNKGKIEEKDGPYINLLDVHVKNKINNLKENLSSNIKIKYNTYQKEKNNLNHFDEYTPFRKKLKSNF